MNRLGDPYGEIRDLFGERDRNEDTSLLHNVTTKSKKKKSKKATKEKTREEEVVIPPQEDILPQEDIPQHDAINSSESSNKKSTDKNVIKNKVIAELPNTSKFDLIDNHFTSTPNDIVVSSPTEFDLIDNHFTSTPNDIVVSRPTDLESTVAYEEIMPTGPNDLDNITADGENFLHCPLDITSKLDKNISKDLDDSKIMVTPEKENSIIIDSNPDKLTIVEPSRRSTRGRVENKKYKDFVK